MKEKPLSSRIINRVPKEWDRGYPIFDEAILKDDVKATVKRVLERINILKDAKIKLTKWDGMSKFIEEIFKEEFGEELI